MKKFFATNADGYIASCEAIRDMDYVIEPAHPAPTLVIVGERDPATPPSAGEAIQKQIEGARRARLDAAHIANIEQPRRYTEVVLNFLRG
jgi:3-oxoadipate enol-lactonase